MTERELMDLITYGEKLTLECKRCEKDIPKSVWETYSSMANTKGGTILLGIDEDPEALEYKHKFVITGVHNADKLLKDFWSIVNGDKVNVNVLIDSDVEVIPTKKGDVISIQIPQADYKKRPVYINGNPYKGAYKRNYEGDYHCTESEVNEMIRDAGDMGNDGVLIEGCSLEDIDLPTLRSYRFEYELRNPDHVWNRLDNKEFLIQLGGYKIDRISKREGLTAAGLLMFGTGLAVRENFDNILMDFRDECNATADRRWNDRVTYDGMWENNLYNFFKRVIPKLVLDIKRPFHMEGISRIDDTLVHKAVREAFINLIIHSDYMAGGVLKIIKRTNCLEFANP